MKFPSVHLALSLLALSSSSSAARISGEGDWIALDRGHRGDLAAMLRWVERAEPVVQPRSNRSALELVAVLDRAGRFEELGLTLEQGRQLVESVYRRFGLPLERADLAVAARSDFPGDDAIEFRAATEIEAIQAVLMRWPFDWASQRTPYSEMVDGLSNSGALIYMWTNTQSQQDGARSYLENRSVPTDHIRWVIEETSTVWIRDYGPNFLHEVGGDGWGLADFHYYNNRPKDDDTPLFVAAATGVPVMNRQSGSKVVYTEGGNLNHDRLGTVTYSERTYSNNQGVDPSVIDQRIRSAFSASQSIVPEDPSLDGTGHIDMFTKIVNENTILVGEYDLGENDYQVLEDAAALFAGSTNGAGDPWNVVRIWQPDVYYVFFIFPVVRTYTNSLIVNDQVLLPTYNLSYDATAVAIHEALMPGKTVHSIDARNIIESGGAWHCVTMEFADPTNPD